MGDKQIESWQREQRQLEKDSEKEFQRSFKALDSNNDRRLSRDELASVLPLNEFMDTMIDFKVQNGATWDRMPEYRPDGSTAGPMAYPAFPRITTVMDDFQVTDMETLANLYRPQALTRERTAELLAKMFPGGVEPVMASDIADQSEKYEITRLPHNKLRVTTRDEREL